MLCDNVLKAVLAKMFESQLKKLQWYGIFRKRLWLLNLLATSLDIVLTMFVADTFNSNLQKTRQIGVEL